MSYMTVLLSVLLAPTFLLAQIPGLGGPKAPESPAQVEDLLGRSTPRGAITAFTDAVHRGDFAAAERTMQLTAAQRARARELALGLSDLMDRYYDQGVTTISGAPEGALDDGLAVDRERKGPQKIKDREHPVELVRV